MFRIIGLVIAAMLNVSLCSLAYGESGAQANNPLAKIRALNFQNYYIGELNGYSESANQFWLRYAQPFSLAESSWLLRASIPLNTFPVPPSGSKKTGIGDANIFAAYLMDTGNPAISFGFGPQLSTPSATEDELGSEKWSAGLVNVLFNANSKLIQYGYLLAWQKSFAGESSPCWYGR